MTLGLLYPVLWRSCFVLNVLIILSASLLATFNEGMERIFYVLLGFAIVWLVQLITFQYRSFRRIKLSLIDCLENLSGLCQYIFLSYTTKNDEPLLNEIKQHEQRRRFILVWQALRRLLMSKQNEKYFVCLQDIEQMYEIVLSLSSLFYRVSDRTTFAVVEQEMSALALSLTSTLDSWASNLRTNKSLANISETLRENIRQLEEVNQTALQVVAPEPLVFLLFIHDLNELSEIMQNLSEHLNLFFSSKKTGRKR